MLKDLAYDSSTGIVRIRIDRDLTADVYRDVMMRITTSPDYPSNVHTIWDLRSVRFSDVDFELFKKMKEIWEEYEPLRVGSRTAIIVPGQQEGRLVALFEAFAIDDDHHLKIVHTMAEAEICCMSTPGMHGLGA